MGKHVDTTRPKDGPSRSYSNAGPVLHRKDDTVRTDIRVMLDVWSGNPDTDRAWREPIVTHEIAPLHQRQAFERR